MNAFFAWTVARLKEPSTYAGIAGVIGSMAFVPHATDVASLLPVVGVAISSIVAVVVPQAKP